MKAKTLIIIFVLSFIISNILFVLDYETVSLIEAYRNLESIFEILFFTFILFVIITIITFTILKIRKLFFNGNR